MEAYEGMHPFKTRQKTRKGQTEVMGLLVIVILLVFLGLIYLGFVMSKGPGELSTIRTNIEAENSLKAVMNVNLDDIDDKSVVDMVVDCGYDAQKCNLLENALKDVFGVILKPEEDFSYSVAMDEDEILAFGNCELGIVSRYAFIKDGIYYESSLKICRKD
tara:strand:- start:2639 stop:3121 length:483 start_codon:yes stop_codon:yes gene_type:complete